MKKFLSLILALIMVLSATAVVFSAAGNTATVSLYDIKGNFVTSNTYAVGETFEVTVYLNTSKIGTIGSLKADQLYTSDVLMLADAYNEESGMIKDRQTMFPVTKNKTTANGKLDGKLSFNASTPEYDPYAFAFDSDDSKLVVSHYTVIAPGEASINNSITTMAYADEMLTRVIDKGVIKIDNFSMRYTLSDPQPVEPTSPPTVKPTEKPTNPPTNPPTEKPTNPPTVKPTNPPTERPTNPPTVKPTNPPTERPTNPPTVRPTNPPTVRPTNPPTVRPTNPSTVRPTNPPMVRPTNPPTVRPTNPPTVRPTQPPTVKPTDAPKPKTGDADGDGNLTPFDVTNIQLYISSMNYAGTEETMKDADIDKNGRIEIIDAAFVQRYLAGIKIPYDIA